MKILVVTQYFWPEQFKINDLCDALVERGHEVTVYTGLPNYPEGTFYRHYSIWRGPYIEYFGKIKIVRVPMIPRGNRKSLQLAVNFFSFFFMATLLAPFRLRGKFDNIFVYEPSPVTVAIPAIFISWIKKIPMHFWVTDLWPESLEATGIIKNKKALGLVSILVNWIYKHSDQILVTSKGFIKSIQQYDVPLRKIKYWPQWAENIFLDSKRNDNYSDDLFPENCFTVLFAGNIGTSQDFESIIEAARILKSETNIKFVILGDGLKKRWAEAEIKKHNISDRIIFLGKKPVETMPYYFKKSSVLLVSLNDSPLFSITVPSKLQTYLASGRPILASLNGEGAQIVIDAEAGLSSPACNPASLASTILEMSKMDQAVLDKMGENALKCYLNQFEREKLVSELENDFKIAQGIL